MSVSAQQAPLTIVITSYNYARYIVEAVRSVTTQTSPEWNLVIYDNRSTDDTVAVLQPFLDDPRVTLVERDTNIGARKNIELGLAAVTTEYVSALQADDFLEPTFVENALRHLRAHPSAPFVFFNWQHYVDETGERHYHNTSPFSMYRSGPVRIGPYLTVGNFVPFHMAVFRTRPLQEKFRLMLDSPLAQLGEQFVLKMLEDEYGPGCYTGTFGGCWRRHSRQMTVEHVANSVAGIEEPIERQWYITHAPKPDPVNVFLSLAAFVKLSSHCSYQAGVEWLISDAGRRYAAGFGLRVDETGGRYRDMALVVALKFYTFTGLALLPPQDLSAWFAKAGLSYSREALQVKLREIRDREGELLLNDSEIRSICDKYFVPARLRVLVLSVEEINWACAQIRLVAPFARWGQEIELIWGVRARNGEYFTDLELMRSADLVVVQRVYAQENHKAYLDLILDLGKPVIYEVDDLMFDIPPDNPHYGEYMRHRQIILDTMARADAVTVSCPALAEAAAPLARQVHVLPNLVDAELFEAAVPEAGEMVTLGLVGTPTHEPDFALLDEALDQVLAAYPGRVRLVFMGLLPARWAGHPAVTYVPFEVDYRAYAGKLKGLGLDIALVPLADTAFNRAKSNIKWLEFSAAGIAGVYSDLPPYAAVRDGATGLKVANTTQAWRQAIAGLVEDPARRMALAQAAQLEVLADWTTAARADEYLKVYRQVLGSRESGGLGKGALSYDPVRFYQIWKQVHVPSLREAEWIAERMTALAAPPRFHLAVIAPPDHEERLVRNIRDLAGQFYRGWRLTVVATLPYPEGLEDLTQLNWIEAPGIHPHVTVNQALQGDGDWVGLLNAGDGLPPQALFRLADALDRHPEWRVIYSDEDKLWPDGERTDPHFRSEFNLDLLRASPSAVGGLFMLRRDLFTQLGGLNPDMDGVETYDLALRALELAGAEAYGHVADVLVHRAVNGGHCPRSEEELQAARDTALMGHFERLGLDVALGRGLLPDSYRVMYQHPRKPRVSIIIPTRNQGEFLVRCVDSVLENTTWPDYEILIVDNGSDEADALDYLQHIQADARVRVMSYPDAFNFAAMNNLAAGQATGEYLLLLNNDTAVLHGDWLDEMMGHAQRPEVGIVGARLLFPNGRVQHAGVILGIRDSPADHAFIDLEGDAPGYAGRAMLTQDLSAVTAACMLVRKSVYDQVRGLDEVNFRVSFNDVDLCLKVREKGLLVVYTPFALLVHEGSVSQRGGVENKDMDYKRQRMREEREAMLRKWRPWIAYDPAYNPNLSLADGNFKIEISPALTFDPAWRPRPRILAHPADRMGCGEYRIIAPMRALNDGGRVMGWETGHYLSEAELFHFEPDSIVLQRQVEWSQIELAERYVRHCKAFRVFELDDLLTNVPVKSSRKKDFVLMKDLHQRFRKAVSLCHRFVVSTDYLAEEYKGYTDEVVAVPNYLERARWGHFNPLRRQGAKPRVGWAGSVTHDGDLLEIIDVVRATAEEVDWVFFGMCPEELRPVIAEFHPPVPLEDYAAKLASLNLDLAVAPLEDVPFNHGKSHLRLLEYGVLGFPVICTDITPYRGDYPVTRVPNRFKDWVEAIRAHAAEPDALAAMGDTLRDHIRERWMLEDNLDVWLKAWLP